MTSSPQPAPQTHGAAPDAAPMPCEHSDAANQTQPAVEDECARPYVLLLDPRLRPDALAKQLAALANGNQSPRPNKAAKLHALFISDLHLGMEHNARRQVLDVLQAYPCVHLYIVGDLIDAWLLPKRWYWDQTADDVLAAITAHIAQGGHLSLVPGNHDTYLRAMPPINTPALTFQEDLIHTTTTGERIFVFHGDAIDPLSRQQHWASRAGARIYARMQMRQARKQARGKTRRAKSTSTSVSATEDNAKLEKGLAWRAKRSTKTTIQWLYRLEQKAIRLAKQHGASIALMGHTHHPKDKMISGYRYLNTGDWVDSCSCVVETLEGHIRLALWDSDDKCLRDHESGDLL